jgi:hypothetical protein
MAELPKDKSEASSVFFVVFRDENNTSLLYQVLGGGDQFFIGWEINDRQRKTEWR